METTMKLAVVTGAARGIGAGLATEAVRRHIKRHRFRPGPRETLLTLLFDIRRRLCGIAPWDLLRGTTVVVR